MAPFGALAALLGESELGSHCSSALVLSKAHSTAAWLRNVTLAPIVN